MLCCDAIVWGWNGQARLFVSAMAPYPALFANQAWADTFSDGDAGQKRPTEWFIHQDALNCMKLPPPGDFSVVREKFVNNLVRAAGGVPSRIAFSRTRRNGLMILSYATFQPVSREVGDTDIAILIILHEYETAQVPLPGESGVVYPIPNGEWTCNDDTQVFPSALGGWISMNRSGSDHVPPFVTRETEPEALFGEYTYDAHTVKKSGDI